ncbi:hypothetical protein ACTQ49_06870 [Luteococcus sp. Sow4_B9]|uniref:hypothetical protein n=1 Tax=Luteococcus sp. Sow4_B9 TaxID=3438792 RepID=UPI003F98034C
MRRFLTVDRLPGLGLAVMLGLGWACADYYTHHAVISTPSPFTPVWTAYDRQGAARLLAWAFVGIGVGLLLPVGGSVPIADFLRRASRLAGSLGGLWTFGVLLALALSVATKGYYMLDAPRYLASIGPLALSSLAGLLLPFGMLASGVVSVRSPRLGALLGCLMAVVLFAGATRLFAASLVLYVAGRVLGGKRDGIAVWIGSLASAFLLLPIPLMCRNQQRHGLLPYTEALMTAGPDAIFARAPLTITENLGFTVPLLQHTVQMRNITAEAMRVQMNPMPAQLAGWNDLMPSMRVHYFIPYSMIGEFAHFGGAALLLLCLGWTLFTRWCVVVAATNRTPAMLLVAAAQLALAMLGMTQMTQYNTRNVFRMLDMMLLLMVLDVLTRGLQHWITLRLPSSVRTLA